ncbi:MAG: amidohydrolase family protein [Myxococcales bacterium]|nr:MAG: amidohydrolase family protein [Myxococcales bacterium]
MPSKLDVLITNALLFTMDADRRIFRGTMGISKGRIVLLSSSQRGKLPPAKQNIDAKGRVLLPGFVQCHIHLAQTLFRGLAEDLPLLHWLSKRIWPLEAAHTARSLQASAQLGVAELLLGGSTCILDMGTVHHHNTVFEVMAQSGIRGFSGKAMMDRGRNLPSALREETAHSLRQSRILFDRWHGYDQQRLAYAFAPRFILSCSSALLRETVKLATNLGAIIHTHAAEHPAERLAVRHAFGKDDIAALHDAGIYGPQVVLAHGVQLRRAEMKALSKTHTRIAHCPSANLKLASGIADLCALRSNGVLVGLGADGAPCNNRLEMWTEMRGAALLAKIKSGDPSALNPMTILSMATIEGARVLGLDDKIGSLEVGKEADFILLDLPATTHLPGQDLAANLVYAGSSSAVSDVWVAGKQLVRNRKLLSLDTSTLKTQATTELKKLLHRSQL